VRIRGRRARDANGSTRDRAHQALALFNDGKSLGSIAAQLGLASGADARELVHDALIEIERRYYR
jgi:hypothetical protein